MQKIIKLQDKILELLSYKINDFYLAGATALSKYYFHHRFSYDLDFFTKNFSRKRIDDIINLISATIKVKIEQKLLQISKTKIQMAVYFISNILRLDFVEDTVDFINPLKMFNGIYVLSLEDIYLRKILTVAGCQEILNFTGRRNFIGKREEAKDFYDLYCLSEIFMNLSDFVLQYCNQTVKEGLIRWFRSYNRMNIISGLLDLRIKKKIDYKKIEQHFKREIDILIEKEIF